MIARASVLLFCFTCIHADVWQMNCKQIREFVDGHNTRRLMVAKGLVPGQPAAAKMASVVWDEELAAKAAKWAARNQFQHNPNRHLPSKKFRTGENLYIFSTTQKKYEFKIDDALESWFKEHKDYTYKTHSRNRHMGYAVGHYTQMVWSNSVYVGCAVSNFKEGSWNKFLVVCDYGPAGNVVSKKPYQSGKGTDKLECGAGNCGHPYGSKCSSNIRTASLNKNYLT